ncbi:MAG: dihydroneopterin aldolase [Alphaproteobacteria bacterium]|nr:dihydroneopterin aldolase [Alphaproteobacteria bacterium]
MTQPRAQPRHDAQAAPRIYAMIVRDLVLNCLIGVHRHERDGVQRVRINLELDVVEDDRPRDDRLAHVLDYEVVLGRIRAAVTAGHVNLVETLAERIAAICLDYRTVAAVRVRVEKLDVFEDAASVGVEIRRARGAP